MPGGNPLSKNKGKKSKVCTEKGADVLAAKQTATFKHTTSMLEEVKKKLEEVKSGKEEMTDTAKEYIPTSPEEYTPQLFKPGDCVTFTTRCSAQNVGAGTVVQYKDSMVVLSLHESIDCLYKKMHGGVCLCSEFRMKFYQKELTIYDGVMKMESSSPSYTPTYTGSPPPPEQEEEVIKGGVTPSWPPKTAEEIEAEKLLDAAAPCFTPTSEYSQTPCSSEEEEEISDDE
jgi:hypothetical protein